MNKIKIFALGGLNEDGKNMYVISVDDSIYVFDAGLKYANESYLGIDYIIPNFNYIKENKKNIKGIFLTNSHEKNYGAITDLIKEIPDIKIFGTKFTVEVLKRELEVERINFSNYFEIEPHKQIDFGTSSIFPVALTNSIPDTVGYVINTTDGAIFYTGDYLFDQSMLGKYKTDIGKLAYIGKKGVLCMLGASMYADKEGYTAPNHRITKALKNIFTKSDNRIIFTVFDSDIYRIQEILDQATINNKKVVIMGKALAQVINDAIDLSYIKFDKTQIGDLRNINDKDIIIITSNERQKPYSTIERIVNGYDKFIKIKPTDAIVLGEAPGIGYEKKSAYVMDGIAKQGASFYDLSSKEYLLTSASSEDIMLMLNLINPKYYIPVRSEYRYQFHNKEIALKSGMKDENVILSKNGDIIEFIDGERKLSEESVNVGEIAIDGDSVDDIGVLVLKDREVLSTDGMLIITTSIDKKSKNLLTEPEITSRGFIYVKDNTDIIEECKKITKEIFNQNKASNFIDYNKVKNEVRDKVGKYLFNQTQSNPMIITVIAEI